MAWWCAITLIAFGCSANRGQSPAPDDTRDLVTFTTGDGVVLRGHLYGSGTTGVILAHMYSGDQTGWTDFAMVLAAHGYTALTFDFRGFSESSGAVSVPDAQRDLSAAFQFLRPRVQRIFLAGASMGADASILVAAHDQVAGVISISTPIRFEGLEVESAIKQVHAPILLITSRDDALVEGNAAMLFQWANRPKTLKEFPGSAHGTDLLHGPYATEAANLILRFIAEH